MKIETFALERWMTTYELNVAADITESGVAPLTVEEVLALLPQDERDDALRALLRTKLSYSEACGSLALRSLLAATYAATGPDEILVTTGAIEANFLVFNVLLEAGDHVVAVSPAYQQLNSVPRAIGCDVSPWRVRPEDDFRFDLDALERLVTPQTKLIVINTPHNPTGSMLTADELRHVYALADAADAWVLCDESYRWLEVPGGPPMPGPMRDLGPRAISVGTFSKPFGLPGIRTGWISAPADVVAACWGLRDYTSLSPTKLSDALAVIALRHRDRIVERTRDILARNLATAQTWTTANEGVVAWRPPQGGLLSLMRYVFTVPALALANRLAEEYGVMLAPGSAFGYEGYLRLGIGQDPAIFADGLARTGRCFDDLLAAGETEPGGLAPRADGREVTV
jgi:aspartate/methionine/tyrosine aminotransferase